MRQWEQARGQRIKFEAAEHNLFRLIEPPIMYIESPQTINTEAIPTGKDTGAVDLASSDKVSRIIPLVDRNYEDPRTAATAALELANRENAPVSFSVLRIKFVVEPVPDANKDLQVQRVIEAYARGMDQLKSRATRDPELGRLMGEWKQARDQRIQHETEEHNQLRRIEPPVMLVENPHSTSAQAIAAGESKESGQSLEPDKVALGELSRDLNSGTPNEMDRSLREPTKIEVKNSKLHIGSEQPIDLATVWSHRIDQLENERNEAERDPSTRERLGEIEKQLESERALLSNLNHLNKLHPDHLKAMQEATALMHEVTAGMRGAHGETADHTLSLSGVAEQRGRITAFTMLLKEIVASLVRH